MEETKNPKKIGGTKKTQSAPNKNPSMQDDNNISSHPSKDDLNTPEKEVIEEDTFVLDKNDSLTTRDYSISFFDNVKSRVPKEKVLNFEEILKYFNEVAKKPFIKKENLEAMICGSFSKPQRASEYLISRSIITYDIDNFKGNFDELLSLIKDSHIAKNTFIYYTTTSSTFAIPRIRLMLFISKDIEARNYNKIAQNIAYDCFSDELRNAIDKSSYSPMQLMFLPNRCSNEFKCGKNIGHVFDANEFLEGYYTDEIITSSNNEAVKEPYSVNLEETDFDSLSKELISYHKNLPLDISQEKIDETLQAYDCNQTDYYSWFMVCQALHHQFKGGEEGLEVFTNWSLSDDRYNQDQIKQECRDKYYSLKRKTDNPVTFASIIKLVNDKKPGKSSNNQITECNDRNYELREDGVYYFVVTKGTKVIETSFWTKLCGYLKPVGIIRDGDKKNWAKVCDFTNKDNVKSEIFVNDEDVTDPTALLKLLLNNGLEVPKVNEIDKGKQTNKLLAQYINSYNPTKRFTGVDKVGWHGNCYLLPFVNDARNSYLVQDTEQGETKEREEYILQSNSANPRNLIRQGTIEGWQDRIGKLVNGNNLLMFSIATAISAPLFKKFNEEGCCFHFSGSSSIGKTTTLYVASSVWGMDKPSSFRTTDNAAESLCKNSNDGLLLMDELAEIDPNSLEKITYLFGNGIGKSRSRKNGEAQAITTFRILGLSTGEIGLQAKLNEKGKNTTAGQSVRFIEIPADSSKGLGIFDTLHHFASGRDLSDYLRKECLNCGGVVIDEWMRYISSNFNDLQKAIIFASKTWLEKYLPQNSDPQVQRVGKKFALIAAIGETAIDTGILHFAQGAISKACKVLFERWLEQRGNNGSHELNGIIKRLKKLTNEERLCRFLNADLDENRTILHLAGYFKNKDTTVYKFLINKDVFEREILEGRSSKIFCSQLRTLGYLIPDSQNGNTRSEDTVHCKRSRYYVVPADKILEVENEELKNITPRLQYFNGLDTSKDYGLRVIENDEENVSISELQIYDPQSGGITNFELLKNPLNEDEKSVLAKINFVTYDDCKTYKIMPFLKKLSCAITMYRFASEKPLFGKEEVKSEHELDVISKNVKDTFLLWDKYKLF